MERWRVGLDVALLGFCLSALLSGGVVFAQAGEQPAPTAQTTEQLAQAIQTGAPPAPLARPGELLNTANKLRLQLDGFFGSGIDSNTVGKTTTGDDIKISAGGGFGFGATIGYGMSRSFDIDCTLGLQISELQPAVENADGSFTRSFLLATVKYKVPIRENLQWKFGLGAGYYMGGKMDIEIDPGVPGAGHYIGDYQNATGVHVTGELEVALQRNLMLAAGLKYYMVEYKAEKATFNGVPVTVPSEFRTLTGDGVDITIGFAVLF